MIWFLIAIAIYILYGIYWSNQLMSKIEEVVNRYPHELVNKLEITSYYHKSYDVMKDIQSKIGEKTGKFLILFVTTLFWLPLSIKKN